MDNWHRPIFPARIGRALAVGAAAMLLLPAVSLLPASWTFWTSEDYIAVHSLMEMFAVAVSALVFGVGWHAPREETSAPMIVIATASLAVALLDFAHMMSWAGMPAFVTPSSPEKAIDFWLAARLASAASLVAVVLWPSPRPMSAAHRRLSVMLSLGYVAGVYAFVLLAPQLLPRTFIPGQGLTPLKIGLEYGITVAYGLSAVVLVARGIHDQAFQASSLLAAALMLAASEMAFTLYVNVSDNYNFVGHLYKVAADVLLYRCVFVQAVRAPFVARVRSERRYRALMEQAADAIFRITADGVISDANRMAGILTGQTGAALTGLRFEALVPVEQQARLTAQIAALDPERPAIWESVLERCGGDTVPVEISARRIDDGAVQAIVRDVTARKYVERTLRAARDEAETASRAKSVFLANMSHELRTPLNAIIGFSELIIRTEPSARHHDYATDILNGGTHLLGLVNSLLDLAKIEAGKFELDRADVALAPVVGEAVHIATGPAEFARRRIDVDIRPQDLTLYADRRALCQILINLLSNALKFTPPEGAIALTAALDLGVVRIAVRDSGAGIDATDIPKLMKPFAQTDSLRRRQHAGAGLGLSLVRMMTELHGGHVSIESEVGRGTTVTLTFPRVASAGAASVAA
jgi:PAS domain S-box-containing protein